MPLFANAQLKKNIEYSGFFDTYYFRGPTIFTLGGGLNLYSGDLCGGFDCSSFNYNASFGVGYQVWSGVVFGGEFSYMKLGATDSDGDRNIKFSGANYELMGFGRYYLRRDIVRRHTDMFKRPKVFKPYLMLGAAGLVYNPTTTYAATGETVTEEGKSYPGITFAIPAGLGASFVISHRVRIMGEITYRYTFSDYLDGVGAELGNSSVKDAVFGFNVKFAYAPLAPRLKKKKRKYSPPSDGDETEGGSDGGSDGGGSEKAAPKKAAPSNNDNSPSEDVDVPEEEYDIPEETESVPAEEETFDDWK